MQATVRSHDLADGSGSMVGDDGTELTYDAAALAAGGLLMLRSGQRVFVRLGPGGAVESVSIWATA